MHVTFPSALPCSRDPPRVAYTSVSCSDHKNQLNKFRGSKTGLLSDHHDWTSGYKVHSHWNLAPGEPQARSLSMPSSQWTCMLHLDRSCFTTVGLATWSPFPQRSVFIMLCTNHLCVSSHHFLILYVILISKSVASGRSFQLSLFNESMK